MNDRSGSMFSADTQRQQSNRRRQLFQCPFMRVLCHSRLNRWRHWRRSGSAVAAAQQWVERVRFLVRRVSSSMWATIRDIIWLKETRRLLSNSHPTITHFFHISHFLLNQKEKKQ